tara:strand:+ start:294 stop:482 length:189 start_codon:yes stop_codon:yes gene_type:complete
MAKVKSDIKIPLYEKGTLEELNFKFLTSINKLGLPYDLYLNLIELNKNLTLEAYLMGQKEKK